MRKHQICVLQLLQHEDIRSTKEINRITDGLTDLTPETFSELEKLEYHIFTLEQQKKLGEAAGLILETIPLKKKLEPNKKKLGKHIKDLCNVLLNWALHSIKNDRKSQAYSVIIVLQKITDKKYPIKFIGRKLTRIKFTGYYFVQEKKYNAGLEFFIRGLGLANPVKSHELAVQLYSMAGFAAFKSVDYKKSSEFHLSCLDIIISYQSEANMKLLETVCYYNLSISSSAQYQRSDAEGYISKALELVMSGEADPVKHKVLSLYEDYFGEVQIEENKLEDTSNKLEFNFIPGALDKPNNKIVELRCETPKDRNKKTKSSKRSYSRV